MRPGAQARLRERDITAEGEAALASLSTFEFASPIAERALASTILAGFDLGSQSVGISLAFGLKSPAVLEFLKQHGVERIGKDVDETTRGVLKDLLVKGYDEAWTQARTIKEIRALYNGFTRKRAQVIAVHEIGRAFSHGTLTYAAELEARGVPTEKRWLLAVNPCPLCQENAGQEWIPSGQNFTNGEDPPLHPRCRCSLQIRAKGI